MNHISHRHFLWKLADWSTEAANLSTPCCHLTCNPESGEHCGDSRLFGSQSPETNTYRQGINNLHTSNPTILTYFTCNLNQTLTGFLEVRLFFRDMKKAMRPNLSFSSRSLFHQASQREWMWCCRGASCSDVDDKTSENNKKHDLTLRNSI